MEEAEVHTLVATLLDEYHDQEWKCVKEFRREIQDEWMPLFQHIKTKQEQIEESITAHAIGVQNVYNKLLEIEKQVSTGEVQRLIRYLESFDPSKIKKQVQQVQEMMEGANVQKVIRHFREFKHQILELLETDLAPED